MMSTTEVIDALLTPDGTVELARKATLPPAQVRVTVETVPSRARQDVWTLLDAIQDERRALGVQARTRAEIDAQIRAQLDEWDAGTANVGSGFGLLHGSRRQ
jgi:hypothetical protein